MRIGIRREDKSPWETRSPLVPHHVADLVAQRIPITVQRSKQRVFTDEELGAAGATITDDLSECDVVLGIKEMPVHVFRPGVLYAFFSHTIKGQPYNMEMLKRLMDTGCHLIDYECIVDQGKRLVFFGVHAGLAGMIDSLWTLGQRAKVLGHDTPLADLKQALHYETLATAEAHVRKVSKACRKGDLLTSIGPVVIGVAGYGRVAQGAQQIIQHLDPVRLTPNELLAGKALAPDRFFVVEFKEEHMVRPKEPQESFDLSTYYAQPERYEADFERFLPHLTVLVNCIYWEPRYPRLVTREAIRRLYGGEQKLFVIGDISCDIEGSIEVTVKPTHPGQPAYIFDLDTLQPRDGLDGRGPAIMAVDILPTELPREASIAFSEALFPLVPELARSDPSGSFEEWALPASLKDAIIVHHGRLTPRFAYLSRYVGG